MKLSRYWKKLKLALDEYKDQVLPKSPMGKAITYALNQWEALNRYIENPILDIDNNISERTLRMVVIGRNYANLWIMRSPFPPIHISLDWRATRSKYNMMTTQHNYSPCKNCKSLLSGLYRIAC